VARGRCAHVGGDGIFINAAARRTNFRSLDSLTVNATLRQRSPRYKPQIQRRKRITQKGNRRAEYKDKSKKPYCAPTEERRRLAVSCYQSRQVDVRGGHHDATRAITAITRYSAALISTSIAVDCFFPGWQNSKSWTAGSSERLDGQKRYSAEAKWEADLMRKAGCRWWILLSRLARDRDLS